MNETLLETPKRERYDSMDAHQAPSIDFDSVYQRLRSPICGYARNNLWRTPGLAPEDLEQELFLALWYAVRGYSPARGSFEGWFWSCARNRVNDLSVKRVPRTTNEFFNDSVVLHPDPDLDGCPHREEVRFRLEGYTLEEIGIFMGKSSETIRFRLEAAKRWIEKHVL